MGPLCLALVAPPPPPPEAAPSPPPATALCHPPPPAATTTAPVLRDPLVLLRDKPQATPRVTKQKLAASKFRLRRLRHFSRKAFRNSGGGVGGWRLRGAHGLHGLCRVVRHARPVTRFGTVLSGCFSSAPLRRAWLRSST